MNVYGFNQHVRSVLERCKEGDIVFIYESASGPIRIVGNEKVYPNKGQKAIVVVVKVSSAIKENTEINNYENRDSVWWRYYKETEIIKRLDTSITLTKVNEILGYSSNYALRGFGEKHSGLKKLTIAQAKAFMQLAGVDIQSLVSVPRRTPTASPLNP